MVADISQPDTLVSALKEGHVRFGPLHGVLHLACVVNDGLLFRKSRESFRRVLEPKIAGTLALDQATRSEPLEFFISFSSAVSVLGNAGQGDYAAACRFQDAFAETRNRLVANGRRHGRTLTIAWSQWAEAGHTAPSDFLEALGVTVLDSAKGLEALCSSWRRPDSFSLVVDGRPEMIRSLLRLEPPPPGGLSEAPAPFANPEAMSEEQIDQELLRLLGEGAALESHHRRLTEAANPRVPASAPKEQAGRTPQVLASNDILAVIEEALGRRLKLSVRPEDRRKPFTDFGLDSINAVKLGSDLQGKLGLEVNPALFWEHPTIEALARKLAAEQRKGVSR